MKTLALTWMVTLLIPMSLLAEDAIPEGPSTTASEGANPGASGSTTPEAKVGTANVKANREPARRRKHRRHKRRHGRRQRRRH